MKRLVLHVGAHRAGSTTVQQLLWNRREELLAHGITALIRPQIQAQKELEPLLKVHRFPPGVMGPAYALSRMTTPAVVVSEENILGRMPGHESADVYPYLSRAIWSLRALGCLFDLRVLWILRRQDTWLESMYSFRVSRGVTRTFAEFAGQVQDNLNLLPLARGLARSRRYELRIGVFERLFRDASSQPELLDLLDLPLAPSGKASRRSNSGVKGPLLHVMRFVSMHEPVVPTFALKALAPALEPLARERGLPTAKELAQAFERAKLERYVARAPEALDFAGREPAPNLSDSERRRLLDRYRADNRELFAQSYVRGEPSDWELG